MSSQSRAETVQSGMVQNGRDDCLDGRPYSVNTKAFPGTDIHVRAKFNYATTLMMGQSKFRDIAYMFQDEVLLCIAVRGGKSGIIAEARIYSG